MSQSRLDALNAWLITNLKGQKYDIAPASSDASFRRYFRVFLGDETLIAMDAPLPQEDCKPFVHADQILLDAGIQVPVIHAMDLDQGFLLLSDLGGETLLDALQAHNGYKLAPRYYGNASEILIKMQQASQIDVFPPYDESLLRKELELFPVWYVEKHQGISLSDKQQKVLQDTFNLLLEQILSQPKVYVHRDYHSRNLMVSKDDQSLGVLDFQDAVYGPITYDLVSLFKDAYIAWDEELILDWTIRYWQKAKEAQLPVKDDFAEFYRDFEWMGIQRHIKVLGIFARLFHRDGKEAYLKDMPMVMGYLRSACGRYPQFKPFMHLLDEVSGLEKQTNYTF
jgi:N-acetylmuramate 1-kinase